MSEQPATRTDPRRARTRAALISAAQGFLAEDRTNVAVLEITEVVRRSELVLLAVPDDALASLVQGLARVGAWQAGQIVVHTSGRHGVRVLDPARPAGVIPLALHPAMTFTGTSLDLSRIVGCPFAVTGPGPVLPIGQALVVEIGGEPVVVAEDDRPLYHAALAHGANHLVTLVSEAMGPLAAAGVDDTAGTLRPLLQAALDNALAHGDAALTGPIVRGDVKTVRAHVAEIERTRPDTLPSYLALARATLGRAVTDGRVLPIRAQRIVEVLDAAARRVHVEL